MREHKLAAIISYVNLLVTNVAGIFMTPFIIRGLGDSEYGLYTLIGAFVGYLSILDLGLNKGIIRFVARYRAENDIKSEQNFLAISFIIYAFIAGLVTLGGVFFYYQVDVLFGDTLTFDELAKAKVMLLILILNIAITITGGAFAGICSAYEKFVYPRLLTFLKSVFRIVLIIVILNYGADAIGLVIVDSVMNLFFISGTAGYVFFKLKIKPKLYEFKFYYLKEVFQYSFWIFLFGLVYQFQWRTGQIILGSKTNTVTVAIYGVGVMLGVYFTTFGNIINSLLLPDAVKSVYTGMDSEQLTKRMIKVGRLTAVLLLYIFGAFLLTGQDFIFLWIGNVYKEAWLVALLIMGVYIVPISQGFGHAILEAKGLLKFKTLAFLVLCALGILLGAFLSNQYGVFGMAVGIVIGLFLLQNVMNYYFHKSIKLNMFSFFKQTYLKSVTTLCFTLLLSYYLGNVIKSHFTVSWLSFALENVSYSFIYFTIVYLFVLNPSEKEYIHHFKRK